MKHRHQPYSAQQKITGVNTMNKNKKMQYNVGTCLGESTEKVEKRDFRAVGNGILWLTPCKLACERSLETGPNIVASVGDGRSW